MGKKKRGKKKESIIVSGLRKIGEGLINSHKSYVLKGLIIDVQSEDATTRLSAIAQLQREFPKEWKEIKKELAKEERKKK